MIYGLTFLSILSVSLSSDITSTTTATAIDYKLQSPAHSVPSSLTNFLREKALKTNSEVIEHTVENFQEDSTHLRTLHLPDNFVGPTYYGEDETCMMPVEKMSILLNYCVNEVSLEGVERSTLNKLNKKTHTLVELNYDGKNCKGIPSKVNDIIKSYIPSFTMETNYGQCFFDSMSGQYATIDYHTTYPTPFPNGYVQTTGPSAECSTTENSGYFHFYWSNYIGYPVPGCSSISEDGSVTAYFRSCADGQIFYDVYASPDCTGDIYATYPLLDGKCYDSGTPEKSDDDDFFSTGSLDSLYCT